MQRVLLMLALLRSALFIDRSQSVLGFTRTLGTFRFARTAGFASLVHNKRVRGESLPRRIPLLSLSLLRPSHYMMAAASSSSAVEVAAPAAEKPVEYFRLDYVPCPYTIDRLSLVFDLDEQNTTVVCTSNVVKQAAEAGTPDLVLDGEDVELVSVKVGDRILTPEVDFKTKKDKLIIFGSALSGFDGSSFQLETQVKLDPSKNLALSGLYKSGSSGDSLLCTQCEAMGFRRITYHLDRPDVLSVYTVRLEGDKAKYPQLLSNGNLVESGASEDGTRHWAVWEDPFPKPSYLFAIVAGNLGSIQSTYTTTSGREVQLGIYSNKENADQLEHAMYSLKESMRWDEDTFNLECDLDTYNIVATNDFNMGAMENKGLNIFNSAYVLADPRTATDGDFERVLGVIGHEYFHNWSGNRVTVRDWFQLTLKEGLTVFRDQWFSSDLTSHAVKRIEDVRGLRSRQFAEDASPLAHPIRPESYISMDNFYTATVYSKGAEVVGMYKTLLGDEGFKKGLALYFQRHDGSAVTCDDFRNAMADANKEDLTQLERWYTQAGTPVVRVGKIVSTADLPTDSAADSTQCASADSDVSYYDPKAKTFTLRLSQYVPTTPGPGQSREEKAPYPLLIPVTVGLLDSTTGAEIMPSTVLRLNESSQSFTFENVPNMPVLSLLRDFSAPVKLEFEVPQSDEELVFLMAHDTDSFNRWDAGSRYFSKLILSIAAEMGAAAAAAAGSVGEMSREVPASFVDAIRKLLLSAKEEGMDMSLVAYAVQLPDTMTLLNDMPSADIERLYHARKLVKKQIAQALSQELQEIYDFTAPPASSEFVFNPQEVGRRRLRNTCLDFLCAAAAAPTTTSTAESAVAAATAAIARAKSQFDSANCMTDKLASLSCLASFRDAPERAEALAAFHKDAEGNALVLNKWFMIQAVADYPGVLDDVKKLKETHPDFTISNPNRARSLISAFASSLYHFHAADGEGYKFIADCVIEIDAINPQVAARMVSSFAQWRLFDEGRKLKMKAQLERILAQEKLSRDTLENVQRCLK